MKIEQTLPTEVIKQFEKLEGSAEPAFRKAVSAGADAIYANTVANLPRSLKKSNFMKCVKKTRVYETPSDGGINCKVMVDGYFTNHLGKKTPAPLVANLFEYGSSLRKYPKQPFMRKSARRGEILKIVRETLKKETGGFLE